LERADVNVKLTDFGTAKMTGDDEARMHTKGVGTALYISPETFNGEPYSAQADVFSFSFVMWELTTHKRPYSDMRSEPALMAYVLGGGREKIPEGCPMHDFIEQCWRADPTERPRFSEIVTALQEVYSKL